MTAAETLLSTITEYIEAKSEQGHLDDLADSAFRPADEIAADFEGQLRAILG